MIPEYIDASGGFPDEEDVHAALAYLISIEPDPQPSPTKNTRPLWRPTKRRFHVRARLYESSPSKCNRRPSMRCSTPTIASPTTPVTSRHPTSQRP